MLGYLIELLILFLILEAQVIGTLNQIRVAVDQLSQEDFDIQLSPQRQDELGQLIHSLIFMAHQLQASSLVTRQSEATNRAILAAIPDLMIRATGDGTYLEIVGQDRLRGIHGVKQFSPGSSVQASLPPHLAELRMHYIQKALTTGELQIYEQQLHLGESPQDEEVRVFVLGDNEVLIMVRDITGRKHNERLQEENLRMGAELSIARQIQQMILPKSDELSSLENLDIAGYMSPADEVGGDYYDVLETDGIVTLSIGDVTGHGLESGLLMIMTQTAVRTLKEVREQDPVRFLDTINRTIYQNVRRMDSDKNLTLALLNYSQGKLSISGQHEEILVVRADGTVERVDTIDLGLPIGIDDNIADFLDYAIVELQPGDGVVLYTDGIPEAYNITKDQYSLERLCEVISQNWSGSAEEIKQAVIQDVRAFIGQQKLFDDIALLVFKQ